ncbi:MAG: Heparin-sulfate lyase precursor [Candidatus Dependentiae bacterium ADurb.Bin331]|nr:MAG: Heparin-sulfate lyase precursor [Candidatus Dependentiae bacterium ADurb.Bin331]
MIEKLPHYFKKIAQLGPKKTAEVIQNRFANTLYQWRQRKRAFNNQIAANWQLICHEYANNESFDFFLQRIKNTDFVDERKIIPATTTRDEIIKSADLFVNNCFDLLGSGTFHFSVINWHQDFRLHAQNQYAQTDFPLLYYKDIAINNGITDQLVKDIKIPWELSRFQHLIVLGKAYALTGDEKYPQTFMHQINDWIEHNPPLLGSNWVCPMDVAIRSLNWIWAFQYFKKSSVITLAFWEKFICSLYDHFDYLEHNWEIYDSRTSNHYFSDLIGYFYLCYFFQPLSEEMLRKAVWCHDQLLHEFDKQVFHEGTSYEGSTSYHQLITEIVYHTQLMSDLFGFNVSAEHTQKFDRMLEFIAWCKSADNASVQIGDNDSGKIIYWGLPTALYENKKCSGKKEYSRFGVSFIKTERLHISLRHHAYEHSQPSGHFHNDVGSMTLAIDGTEIFVDPGSFVYTPSALWRNRFRSVAVHNAVSLNQQEPIAFDERLFALELPEKKFISSVHANEQSLYAQHELYKNVRFCRKIDLSIQELLITDWCQKTQLNDLSHEELVWNFTIHPTIDIVQNNHEFIFFHEQKKIMVVHSSLNFILQRGWFSPAYGTKISCLQLIARLPFNCQQHEIRCLL